MDRILTETREEIEEKQKQVRETNAQRKERKTTVGENQVEIKEDDVRIGLGYISSIMGPEICFTTEEKKFLSRLFGKQIIACRNCCPDRFET